MSLEETTELLTLDELERLIGHVADLDVQEHCHDAVRACHDARNNKDKRAFDDMKTFIRTRLIDFNVI